jgi:hypothetical protein
VPLKINTLAGYTVDQYVRPFYLFSFLVIISPGGFMFLLGDDYRQELERYDIENFLLTYCEYFRRKISIMWHESIKET